MKIGIATDTNTDDAAVSMTFEQSGYLVIVETDTMHAEAIIENEGNGRNYPQSLTAYDCEAVVCGMILQEAFEKIADAQITRYQGYGLTIGEAAEAAKLDLLPLIMKYEGGRTCREEEHSGSCECGKTDEHFV